MNLAALVPTLRRPTYLRRCLDALIDGRLAPSAIVVVIRTGDTPTSEVLDEIAPRARARGIALVRGEVSEPGHLPPLVAGRALVPRGIDAVVVVDDDLFVSDGAFERIAAHLADPTVGVVAGHAIEHDEGVPRPRVDGRGGGHVSWFGTIYAGHSHASPPGAREVEWAAGLLAAYRREVFDALTIRSELNENVAVGYEVDWGLQARAAGWRCIYDPAVCGDHHNAPRGHGTQRNDPSVTRVYWQNRNHVYLLLHHLRGARRIAYLANTWFVARGDWAIGTALAAFARRGSTEWWGLLGAAYRGKLDGMIAYSQRPRP